MRAQGPDQADTGAGGDRRRETLGVARVKARHRAVKHEADQKPGEQRCRKRAAGPLVGPSCTHDLLDQRRDSEQQGSEQHEAEPQP